MNKTELIAAVAEKTGMSKKDTEAVIAATLGTITAALHEEEKVQLMGFGSFEVKKRAARTGRNPRSKETIEIPASQTPVFKAGKALKDAGGPGFYRAAAFVRRESPKRRRWRMKRGDFEEVPRLSAATAGESRLARRWADMGPALRECVLKDCRHAGPALRSV